MSLVDRLFARLGAFYGARFADMWRDADPVELKRIWAEELAGFTAEEIARGIDGCRTRDWPPTLPEFLKLCRPPLDYEAAFCEAAEQMYRRQQGEDRWSDAAIYWAATWMGRDVMAVPFEAVKGRWRANLDLARQAIRAGELPDVVPPRMTALPTPGATVASADDARAILRGEA